MRRKKRKIKEPKFHLSSETKKDIFVVFIFALAFLSLLSMFDLAGSFGQTIDKFWQMVFGWAYCLWPFILIVIGYLIINREKYGISARGGSAFGGKTVRWIGLFLFILTLSGLLQLFVKDKTFETVKLGEGGGIVGYIISMPLEKITSFWGALIVLIALLLISLLLFFETSFKSILEKFHLPEITLFSRLKEKIRQRKERKKLESYQVEEVGFEQKEISDTETPASRQGGLKHFPLKAGPAELRENTKTIGEEERVMLEGEGEQVEMFPSLKKRKYPKIDIPVDLLNGKISKPTSGDIKASQEIIKKTLANFGIEVEMGEVSVGPTVTQYTLRPKEGIKLSQITTLSNDLALALAAHPIRIEAPIPGKSLVGIEVPNQKVALVPLKEVLSSKEFKERKSNLTIALGKDVAGKPWLADLGRMPHLLIAGATGSGKTVMINSIIVSLIYQNQPDDLKLILVDPKRVELPIYNGTPHLICPVITEVKKTVNALRWTVKEMDRRFEILSKAGKRNIDVYNLDADKRGSSRLTESQINTDKEKMAYIVVIIDELADLMAIAAAEVETAIIRLSQMARATGIHLAVATQRPSVDVITGLIKANITSRIAFSVASLIDSRTILDYSGAEKLLGRGDMLFISPEISKPKRLQGAFVSDEEIERIVRYLKQKGAPDYNEEVTKLPIFKGIEEEFSWPEGDELLPEAKELVIRAGKASASYLQRRLRIGYARAARLLDLLEDQGIVGPADGAKPREVLVKTTTDFRYEEEGEETEDEENKEENI